MSPQSGRGNPCSGASSGASGFLVSPALAASLDSLLIGFNCRVGGMGVVVVGK